VKRRQDLVLKRGSKIEQGYATVVEEDGINYREISEIMTQMGYDMKHSSVRNYILRTMKKFADALVKEWGIEEEDLDTEMISRSPQFQKGIGEILHVIYNYEKEDRENV
jgi:hypothetical protein